MNETQFSKKLNATEKNKLDKVFDEMMIEKQNELTTNLDKKVEDTKQNFLKNQKNAQKLVQTIAKAWKELNTIMAGTMLDTDHNEENTILVYKDYKYNNEKHAPEVQKAKLERNTKLNKLNEIKRALKMRLWTGDVTYDEMKKMIDEKLATL